MLKLVWGLQRCLIANREIWFHLRLALRFTPSEWALTQAGQWLPELSHFVPVTSPRNLDDNLNVKPINLNSPRLKAYLPMSKSKRSTWKTIH